MTVSTIAVFSGNAYNISAGETDINDLVYAGGTLNVLSGGSASFTTDYGAVNVSAGAVDFADYVLGAQYVYGSATDTEVASGGTQITEFTMEQSFFTLGTAIDTVIDNGGLQEVSIGTAIGTVDFGIQEVEGIGIAIGAIVYSDQYVSGFGTANGSFIKAGGVQYLSAHATASDTVIDGTQFDLDFASASDTVIDSGARQYVENNAFASGTVVNGGGDQCVYDFATVSGTIIASGGDQYLREYSTAIGTVVSRGVQYLYDYSTAIGTVVNSGGEESVEDSATASSTTISKGGLVDVGIYASAVNPVMSGGSLFVGGTLLIEDASLSVSAGAVTLSAGAQIDLENGQLSSVELPIYEIPSGVTVDAIGGTNALSGVFSNDGTIRVDNGATLTLNGIFAGGTVLANSGTIVIAGEGPYATVVGGLTLINNGVVDILHASKEDVEFQSGGTGGLELADAGQYTGEIGDFGGSSSQFIDFPNITSSGATVNYTSTSTDTGVLTVGSGGHIVASIDFFGHYVTSNFIPGNDGSGHLEITDPPVGTVTGGAVTTPAYNVALLGSYMASLFASTEGQVSTQVTAETGHSVAALASPHTV